ncbi:unnamed protein product, partial [Ectocarpus sp. 8 AP-2014]
GAVRRPPSNGRESVWRRAVGIIPRERKAVEFPSLPPPLAPCTPVPRRRPPTSSKSSSSSSSSVGARGKNHPFLGGMEGKRTGSRMLGGTRLTNRGVRVGVVVSPAPARLAAVTVPRLRTDGASWVTGATKPRDFVGRCVVAREKTPASLERLRWLTGRWNHVRG